MIQTIPAILTNNTADFQDLLKKFDNFDSIDIDVCVTPFTKSKTLGIDQILPILVNDKRSLGFHLMEQVPESSVNELMKSLSDKDIRIYMHQESNLAFLKDLNLPKKWTKGLVVKVDTELTDVGYYNKFDEVSFMTVDIGAQASKFQDYALTKIENLRLLGYKGKISIDGGVNLNTAKTIKDYAIDRVSVGSYFVKATDVELAKMKLDLALNIR